MIPLNVLVFLNGMAVVEKAEHRWKATNVLEYRRRAGTVKSLKVRAVLKSDRILNFRIGIAVGSCHASVTPRSGHETDEWRRS